MRSHTETPTKTEREVYPPALSPPSTIELAGGGTDSASASVLTLLRTPPPWATRRSHARSPPPIATPGCARYNKQA